MHIKTQVVWEAYNDQTDIDHYKIVTPKLKNIPLKLYLQYNSSFLSISHQTILFNGVEYLLIVPIHFRNLVLLNTPLLICPHAHTCACVHIHNYSHSQYLYSLFLVNLLSNCLQSNGKRAERFGVKFQTWDAKLSEFGAKSMNNKFLATTLSNLRSKSDDPGYKPGPAVRQIG